MTRTPRISVGLPVRNGENFLRDAIDGLLAQTFEDFELVIADNASTDATETIGREAAARDPRVRFVRHAADIGGPGNFNFVFGEARAPYFRWAAHDDVVAPGNLAACLTALDGDPSAVLAAPDSLYIDGAGDVIRTWRMSEGLAAPRPARRMVPAALAIPAFFGLIRTDGLRTTRLLQAFPGGDCVLLLELCLRGHFRRVPEQLFTLRDHGTAYSRVVLNTEREAAWLDPQGSPKTGHWRWRVLGGGARAIREAPLGARDRAECRVRLARLAVAWHRPLLDDLWATVRR